MVGEAKARWEALAAFQAAWITTGLAGAHKHGSRLNLFSAPPPQPPVAAGAVRISCAGVYAEGTNKRDPSAGVAVEACVTDSTGREHVRLRAHAAVASQAFHGSKAPPHAPSRHTLQAARQAALAAALTCAEAALMRTQQPVDITSDSVVALQHLHAPLGAARDSQRHRTAGPGKRRRLDASNRMPSVILSSTHKTWKT